MGDPVVTDLTGEVDELCGLNSILDTVLIAGSTDFDIKGPVGITVATPMGVNCNLMITNNGPSVVYFAAGSRCGKIASLDWNSELELLTGIQPNGSMNIPIDSCKHTSYSFVVGTSSYMNTSTVSVVVET